MNIAGTSMSAGFLSSIQRRPKETLTRQSHLWFTRKNTKQFNKVTYQLSTRKYKPSIGTKASLSAVRAIATKQVPDKQGSGMAAGEEVRGEWEVGPEHHRMRLDRFLSLAFKHQGTPVNQKRVRKAVRGGGVQLKGVNITKINHFVKEGDVFSAHVVSTAPLSQLQLADLDWPAMILFEDNDVIGINKPAGLASTPAPGEKGVHVVSLLEAHLLERDGIPAKLHAVHRLDKGTSGALLLAKTPEAASVLGHQFKLRKAKKTYWAALCGHLKVEEGEILKWHDMLRSQNGRSHIVDLAVPDAINTDGKVPKAKTAKMTCKVLESFGRKMTTVEIELQTGRMHQIRAQSASRNHFVIGDDVYGTAMSGSPLPPRMCLHARTLTIAHPTLDEVTISLDATLPEDLESFIQSYRP